jgi:hypothetical protein
MGEISGRSGKNIEMAGVGCYFYIQLALAMKSAGTVLAKGPEADDFYWATGPVEVFFLLKGLFAGLDYAVIASHWIFGRSLPDAGRINSRPE